MLLAYGRFLLAEDAPRGRALIERARGLFEDMEATGWIAEARAALGAAPGGPAGREDSSATGA